MRKVNYYSNILKKGTIIFNCATFVNYCSDINTNSDEEYKKLLEENKGLKPVIDGLRTTVQILNAAQKAVNFFTGNNKTITPISLLNEKMFRAYCNLYDFEIDEINGVHYTLIEKAGCNKYIVFFHGIMDSINWLSEEINCKGVIGGLEGKEKYKNLFKSLDYNVILIEYNSIFNKKNYESTKKKIYDDDKIEFKDIKLTFSSKEYEDLYGIDQINAISNLMYDTIKRILKDKKIDKLILAAHSHGNNYGLEILKKFINDKDYKDYKDKLVYWGCKGYLNIERTILTAAKSFLESQKSYKNFYGIENLYERINKIWSDPSLAQNSSTLGIVEKVLFILKELPLNELLTFFKLLFYEYYDKIVEENDNETRLVSMFDNLDIKNYKLSKENHAMKRQDFVDMEKAYNEYTTNNSNDKIPCLLFYADNDEFVGNEFKNTINNKKSEINIEDLAKQAANKENKYKKENLTINENVINIIKKSDEENKKEIEEYEKKIQKETNDASFKLDMSVSKKNIDEGARSFVLNIDNGNDNDAIEKYKKEKEKENTKKEEGNTTTTTKKKCCNCYKNNKK